LLLEACSFRSTSSLTRALNGEVPVRLARFCLSASASSVLSFRFSESYRGSQRVDPSSATCCRLSPAPGVAQTTRVCLPFLPLWRSVFSLALFRAVAVLCFFVADLCRRQVLPVYRDLDPLLLSWLPFRAPSTFYRPSTPGSITPRFPRLFFLVVDVPPPRGLAPDLYPSIDLLRDCGMSTNGGVRLRLMPRRSFCPFGFPLKPHRWAEFSPTVVTRLFLGFFRSSSL